MSVLPSRDFNNFPKALIYNFCAVAYSSLGYIHTAEAKAAISAAHAGENNPIFGKTHSAETKAAISATKPGTTHTAETKGAISAGLMGNTNRLGKTGYTHTAESIDLIRINQPSRMSIFVYEHESRKLVGEFLSLRHTANYLSVSHITVRNYLASGKVLNNKYIIRTSPFSSITPGNGS